MKHFRNSGILTLPEEMLGVVEKFGGRDLPMLHITYYIYEKDEHEYEDHNEEPTT